MVKEIRGMGMEVCTTLGMLTPEQVVQLKNPGVTARNHNVDTSREYYDMVVTLRIHDDRTTTISDVREAGISGRLGGILRLDKRFSRWTNRSGMSLTSVYLPLGSIRLTSFSRSIPNAFSPP
ncbi:hypothetical protein CF326_g6995 [Tilletia indica]|nr:hypothetical protein CF326_g6995 [Tilletia indica]